MRYALLLLSLLAGCSDAQTPAADADWPAVQAGAEPAFDASPPDTLASSSAPDPLPARFLRQACGSIVDTETRTEWFVGPVASARDAAGWASRLSRCGSEWNLPSVAELATLSRAGDAPGVPSGFSGVGRRARVWADSSEADERDGVLFGSFPAAYDFGEGRVVIERGSVVRPLPTLLLQTFASRPFFTDADRQAEPPAFSAFPAPPPFTGRAASVRLAGPQDRMFRTRLRQIGAGPADFAGEYAFGCWGAGMSNGMCAAVHLPTGTVVWAPGTIFHGRDARSYDDPTFEPVEVRPDSRLLVLRGMVGERVPNGDHYYELRDGAFRLVRTIPQPLYVE